MVLAIPSFLPDFTTFRLMAVNHLDLVDILQLSQVSRATQNVMGQLRKDSGFWSEIFIRDGIPRVQNFNGEVRNLEEDYKNLYRSTLSGRMIGQFIGKMVGPAGEIKADVYKRFLREGGEFVVVPPKVERTVGKDFPFELNEQGTLVKIEDPAPIEHGKVLTIPFDDFYNLNVLCEHPLSMGKRQGPFLTPGDWNSSCFREIGEIKNVRRNIAAAAADKAKIYYLQKGVVLLFRKLTRSYDDYVIHFKERGLKAMPILPVALRSAMEMFNTGNCSLGDDAFAAASYGLEFPQISQLRANIGCYNVGGGLNLNLNTCIGDDNTGAVAGLPAEV